MIASPRRSVTRFFIPMIDVLILLFCIFLLMPFVSAPASPEDQPKEQPKPKPLTKHEELQAQLDEATRRLRQLEKERAKPADQYSVRILEISSSVALRLASPITNSRTDPCPMNVPKLGVTRVAATLSRSGFNGIGEEPSGPSINVVTPWRR